MTVSFGDGGEESIDATSANTTIQHVYTSDGSKTARVTVTDSNGGITSSVTIVFVQMQASIVSLTISSSSGGGTTSVTFIATVTPSGTSVAPVFLEFLRRPEPDDLHQHGLAILLDRDAAQDSGDSDYDHDESDGLILVDGEPVDFTSRRISCRRVRSVQIRS